MRRGCTRGVSRRCATRCTQCTLLRWNRNVLGCLHAMPDNTKAASSCRKQFSTTRCELLVPLLHHPSAHALHPGQTASPAARGTKPHPGINTVHLPRSQASSNSSLPLYTLHIPSVTRHTIIRTRYQSIDPRCAAKPSVQAKPPHTVTTLTRSSTRIVTSAGAMREAAAPIGLTANSSTLDVGSPRGPQRTKPPTKNGSPTRAGPMPGTGASCNV